MMHARRLARRLASSFAASIAMAGFGVVGFGVACLALASPAMARPQLLSSDPLAGASLAHVSTITLTFSETVVAALSGIEVTMTAMPGMADHAAMKMTGLRVSLGAGGTTLVASLARPLMAGTYEASWHAASADAQKVSGKLTFTVQ